MCEDYYEEDSTCLRATPNRRVSCNGCIGDCDLMVAHYKKGN